MDRRQPRAQQGPEVEPLPVAPSAGYLIRLGRAHVPHPTTNDGDTHMRYEIEFYGTRNGSLNAAYKEHVVRTVEADTPDEAALKAYETHEHIPGGSAGVKVTALETK